MRRLLFPVVLYCLFVWSVSSAYAFKLPDTGQTKCYQAVDPYAEISCPLPGGPLAQDGSYNINPLSYTDNGDGTVRDNNTGLLWQKQDDGFKRTWDDAKAYCSSLNLVYPSGWRLPTKKDLVSIVDYSIPYDGPTIDPVFPNTQVSSAYWSSTTLAGNPNNAWLVGFNNGEVFYDITLVKLYVRCVRGEEFTAPFTDNGNGTVTDTRTGLMWQKGEPGYMDWASALSYCEGLELPSGSGQSDWRLPNVKELESLTDDTIYTPSLDTSFFPDVQASFYWSSTTLASYTYLAWYVDFDYGYTYNNIPKDNNLYVRCVRGGRQSESLPLNTGWNLITLPLDPITPYTAQSALTEISVQGGNCTEMDRWSNGAWDPHLIVLPGINNFGMDMGKGYFLKCLQSSTWTVNGNSSYLTLPLSTGWNLVGIPTGTFTAQGILTEINAQGGNCVEIDRWSNGAWDPHLIVLPGINNFNKESWRGYFLKCSQSSTWQLSYP